MSFLHIPEATVALAVLEGGVVALPRPWTLGRLRAVRSPAWAAVLPGAIIIGTFGVLASPDMASDLLRLATVTTPLLAAIALMAIVPGRWSILALPPLWLLAVAAHPGTLASQASATVVTALACLTTGAAIARLVPRRWLAVGALLMCLVDVVMLAAGIGQPAAILMDRAMHAHHAVFAEARLGTVTVDYPDLVLAAVIGGILSEEVGTQRRAALMVAVLSGGCGLLLFPSGPLPATVPIAGAFLLLRLQGRWRRRRAASAPPAPANGPPVTVRVAGQWPTRVVPRGVSR